jgi:O-antigen/teichoic acid export membrane protein
MIERVKLSVLNAVLFLGLSLALDLLLILRWGLVGAAVAGSTAVAAVNLLRPGQVRSILGILPYDRRFLRPVAAGILSGALAWIIPYLSWTRCQGSCCRGPCWCSRTSDC